MWHIFSPYQALLNLTPPRHPCCAVLCPTRRSVVPAVSCGRHEDFVSSRTGLGQSGRSFGCTGAVACVCMSCVHLHRHLSSSSPLCPVSQVIDEIGRDVNRTFPSHRLFQEDGPGQGALKRVLERYAILDPAIGYCQGMGFLAALLLQYLHEHDAFYALVSLMNVRIRVWRLIVLLYFFCCVNCLSS